MPDYPFVFTFNDTVSGNGFLANVTMTGRAVMAMEDGSWWMFGVRPAALAAKGDTPPGSYIEFRMAYKKLLFDTAAFSQSFEGFKAEVERFFYERDESEERRWDAASSAIQAERVRVEAPFDTLPREAPEVRPVSISVDRLDKAEAVFTASNNVLDNYAISAAAA
jgi:hypothetical protein